MDMLPEPEGSRRAVGPGDMHFCERAVILRVLLKTDAVNRLLEGKQVGRNF